MDFLKTLQYKYKTLSLYEKIIAINVVVFFIQSIVIYLFGVSEQVLIDLFGLTNHSIFTPWSFITHAFLHNNLGQLFWSSVVLYFSGQMFTNLLSGRYFLNIFLSSIFLSGLLFFFVQILSPNLISPNAVYIGSDGGSFGVLFFVVGYMGYREVRFFLITIKLWQVGVFLAGVKVLGLLAGGDSVLLVEIFAIAWGYICAKQFQKGNDLGSWVGKTVDWVLQTKTNQNFSNKKVKKDKAAKNSSKKTKKQRRIDDILDKISKNGYDSLTDEEKKNLFETGED